MATETLLMGDLSGMDSVSICLSVLFMFACRLITDFPPAFPMRYRQLKVQF